MPKRRTNWVQKQWVHHHAISIKRPVLRQVSKLAKTEWFPKTEVPKTKNIKSFTICHGFPLLGSSPSLVAICCSSCALVDWAKAAALPPLWARSASGDLGGNGDFRTWCGDTKGKYGKNGGNMGEFLNEDMSFAYFHVYILMGLERAW